jgi:hypothetical protein
MKKIFLIFLFFNICYNINAQEFSVKPSIGNASFHFAGNGTCSSTSVLSYHGINNPFNNNYSNAIKYQIDFQYLFKNKTILGLGFNTSNHSQKLALSKAFNADGLFRNTTGYINSKFENAQMFFSIGKMITIKPKLSLFFNVGIEMNILGHSKTTEISFYDYEGKYYNTDSFNVNNSPLGGIIPSTSNTFRARTSLGLSFHNFNLESVFCQGLKNYYSGQYKDTHDDTADYNIYTQEFQVMLGYSIKLHHKKPVVQMIVK